MTQVRSTQLHSLSFGEAALRSRPDLTIRLAAILDEWSAIEGFACVLLALLLPGRASCQPPSAFALRLRSAKALLGRVHNFRLKLDMIRAAAKVVLNEHEHPGALDLLNKCLDNAGKAEGERNKLAHKAFGACPKYKNALIAAEHDEMNVALLISARQREALGLEDFLCQIITENYLADIQVRFIHIRTVMAILGRTLIDLREDVKVNQPHIDEHHPRPSEELGPQNHQNTQVENE